MNKNILFSKQQRKCLAKSLLYKSMLLFADGTDSIALSHDE